MTNIDFSQLITAEDKAAQAHADRARQIKSACRSALLAVVNESAQANIAQAGTLYAAMRVDGVPEAEARAEVGFQPGDLVSAGAWNVWRGHMLTECRRAIEDGDDPVWPDVPAGVAEMAARF